MKQKNEKKKKTEKEKEKETTKAIRLLRHVIANCIKESNNSFFVLSSSFSFLHLIFLCILTFRSI